MHSKRWVVILVLGLVFFLGLLIHTPIKKRLFSAFKPPVKVGILHSLSGPMAINNSIVSAELMAIDEINQSGGILGAKLIPIIRDGGSEPAKFQSEAERLITEEKVQVIFGCWTSSSRKAVKSVVEKYNNLLIYPVQYEGLEESPNIIYLGAAPNQQLIPAVTWSMDNLGKRFFLIGSDYLYAHVANEIAKSVIGYKGGKILGEAYVPLGGRDFREIIRKIKQSRPDVIFNTIIGDSNSDLIEALHDQGINTSKIPIFSLHITESEITRLKQHLYSKHPNQQNHFLNEHLTGIYACWNYFQSIDNPRNQVFVKKLQQKYGREFDITDAMEAAYSGVHIWARAMIETKGINTPKEICNVLPHISFSAPEGIITIADNQHARKMVYIAKSNAKGDFDIVWHSKVPIEPAPYPVFRRQSEWETFLQKQVVQYDLPDQKIIQKTGPLPK